MKPSDNAHAVICRLHYTVHPTEEDYERNWTLKNFFLIVA